jgi:peptide/nickel transport system permease protein
MSVAATSQWSGAAAWLRALGGDPRAALGLGLVTLASVAALSAALIAPYAPDMPDFVNTLAPPSSAHWLGTDELGRDVLSRIIYGARTSLLVGLLSVAVAALAGTALGLLSGYFGRLADAVIMRTMDVVFAFPSILLALAITAVLGPSLTNAVLAIAVVNLPVFARVARAQTLVVRELEYVEAKRALGFGTGNILLRTVLPNILAPIIVQGSLLFASAIITESYLSFLGLGAQPPTATWGNMLRNAIGFMELAPWLAVFPGAAIFLTVLGCNLLGDGLRDRFDPRD